MDRALTTFDTEVRRLFKTIKDEDSRLRYFQNVVLNYVKYIKAKNGPRGLLIAADPGMGKTRLAIAIQSHLFKSGQVNKCYVITLRSLHDNYAATLPLFGKDLLTEYISLNASNFGEKIRRLNFHRAVVVFDEAHKFASMVVNGSVNAVDLYMRLKAERMVHTFFITGTPITSRSFELAVYYNILAGYALFPENEEDFVRAFGGGRNMDKMQDRVRGMSSFAHVDTSSVDFPRIEPIEVVKCELTDGEYSMYKIADEAEKRETAFKAMRGTGNKLAFAGANKVSSSYRVRTRQLGHCEAKINYLVQFILAHPNECIAIYSQFITNYGIALMNAALNRTGIYKKYFDDEKKEAADENEGGAYRYYINMTSEFDSDMRTQMQNEWNDPANKDASRFHVLFLSKATTAGLTFKHVRYAFMLEPDFVGITMEQYFGRFYRFGCQNDFAPEDRWLKRFILLAKLPIDAESTDEILYRVSNENLRENKRVLAGIEAVSIEALAGTKPPAECRICAPTGERLFTQNFYADIDEKSRCRPINDDEEIEAEQIVVDGKAYYYDTSDVYVFDETVEGYLALPRDSDEYRMVRQLINKEN
jgi:DNA polymerase III delta prime subunit